MSDAHRRFLAQDDDESLAILYGLDKACAQVGAPAVGLFTAHAWPGRGTTYEGTIAQGYLSVTAKPFRDAQGEIISIEIGALDGSGMYLDRGTAILGSDGLVEAVRDALYQQLSALRSSIHVIGTWTPATWNVEFLEQVQDGFVLAWRARAPVALEPLTWAYSKFTRANALATLAQIDFVPPSPATGWGFIRWLDIHTVQGEMYDSAALDRNWQPTGRLIARSEAMLRDDETPAEMGGWLADMLLHGRSAFRGGPTSGPVPQPSGGMHRFRWRP